jgi:hypothetical protein
MRELVVEESFGIAGRGTAACFRGSAEGLPLGRVLRVRIQRPDGSCVDAEATVELLLRRLPPQPGERAALLISGLSRDDVPPGSLLLVDG